MAKTRYIYLKLMNILCIFPVLTPTREGVLVFSLTLIFQTKISQLIKLKYNYNRIYDFDHTDLKKNLSTSISLIIINSVYYLFVQV